MPYKDKDRKTWTAQWFEENVMGEKVRKRKRGFKTKKEAVEYEVQQRVNSGKSMDMTLSAFIDVYFEDKQNELKERTLRNKRYMMEQHIVPYFGNKKMNEITAAQIIQWQNEMQKRDFSDAYLRMIQNQLTSLFTHASKIYDLPSNPCKKVKKMGNFDSRSLDFWTVEEYKRFRDTIEPGSQYYLVFEMLFWTGCRIGELLALTPKDIDFARNQMSITKTYYRNGGKDYITEPKTKQSIRVIEIPEFLKQEIQKYVDGHYGMPQNERLFPIGQEAVQHKLKRHVEQSGVKKIRVHDLRHSQGRHSYGHLCAKIVANRFKNGIKLYDSKDLDLLRRYVLEEYGDIDVPEDNRALSARLSDILVLCGRGAVIASENIQIEMSLLDEIKSFIDDSPEGELYYSNLYSEFEGMLQMLSNVDNYNFLHGVLMLYYPDDYYYTRDYLKKKGSGYLSGRLSDKISRFIKENEQPTHKNDIMRRLSGMSDIVLFNAVSTSDDLFMWDYNTYYSLDLLDYNDSDLNYLKDVICTIMDSHVGYCSDRLLYSYVQKDNSEFLRRNQMNAENNLYYFCARTLGDTFDFRRPHIGEKGLMQEMSAKNVALYMLQNPDLLSYGSYASIAEQLMWAAVTTGMVFSEIEQGYVRISDDLYVKKDLFAVTKAELIAIENCICKHMNHGFISLMTVDFGDELPNIGYEWNGFLLHSVLIHFSEYYKIIEPRVKDRRFEKGIIVINNAEIQDYMDVIICLLKSLGQNEISENNMTSLLIINGLAYKMIPHEVYVSEKITYKDERFYIV